MSLYKIFAMMADEVEFLRNEGVEHHLILADVVADLQRLAEGGTSMLAADALQRQNAALPKNEPDTNRAEPRPWEQIPAGWFVQAPKSEGWYEVMETRAMHSGLQLVTMRAPDGKPIETRRPAGQQVTCCPGAQSPSALGALFGAFPDSSIIADQAD